MLGYNRTITRTNINKSFAQHWARGGGRKGKKAAFPTLLTMIVGQYPVSHYRGAPRERSRLPKKMW